ncbi:MAG: hypothetical protein ACYDC8_12975 [Gammaproteobacteria bacterium]
MPHTTRIAALFSIISLLSACAPAPVRVTDDNVKALQGAQVRVVHFEPADFAIMTTTNMTFGPIGAVAAVKEGNAMVREDGIDDPSAYIGHALAERLGQTYHFAAVSDVSQSQSVKADDPAYAKALGHDGLVIDVRSYMWSFIYYPTHWTKYKALYSARARIIDVKTGAVIGQQTCQVKDGDADSAPGYDELTANKGQVLKEQIRKAADTCVMQIADKIPG